MRIYYVLFRVDNQQLPYTGKPNTPWKLFWAGDDPEMAWRNYGLFQKDSPIRVYRNTKVQLRSIRFKDKQINSDFDKPEDFNYTETR